MSITPERQAALEAVAEAAMARSDYMDTDAPFVPGKGVRLDAELKAACTAARALATLPASPGGSNEKAGAEDGPATRKDAVAAHSGPISETAPSAPAPSAASAATPTPEQRATTADDEMRRCAEAVERVGGSLAYVSTATLRGWAECVTIEKQARVKAQNESERKLHPIIERLQRDLAWAVGHGGARAASANYGAFLAAEARATAAEARAAKLADDRAVMWGQLQQARASRQEAEARAEKAERERDEAEKRAEKAEQLLRDMTEGRVGFRAPSRPAAEAEAAEALALAKAAEKMLTRYNALAAHGCVHFNSCPRAKVLGAECECDAYSAEGDLCRALRALSHPAPPQPGKAGHNKREGLIDALQRVIVDRAAPTEDIVTALDKYLAARAGGT